MRVYRLVSTGLGLVLFLAAGFLVQGQRGPQQPATPPPSSVPVVPSPRMPLSPQAVRGGSVTPALEGWVKNADGTTTILVGYMNRNEEQTFDVPIGSNNSIEPGGPDFGQPTHFEVGRHYGVFSVTVPRDFGTKRLTYTINVNNQPQTITLGLPNGYQIEPYLRNDTGNTPPVAKLQPNGPEFKGPPHGSAQTLTATVGLPLNLTLYVTDKGNTINLQDQSAQAQATPSTTPATPAARRGATSGGGGATAAGTDTVAAVPDAAGNDAAAAGTAAARARGARQDPIRVTWYKHRGPAGDNLKFDPTTPMVVADPEVQKMFEKPGDYTGKATAMATFTEAGEYWLRAQINDATGNGGGGDQCCWTNVLIKVNVQASPAAR
ncbi:MAG TPA: hypothetical protein VFR18_01745 [Terriglobia bacterium]|nr:hypothetical protein [Terriglobia bacterium]